MTQRERVLRHLEDVGSISSYEAFQEYGITRLSAVIFDLKKEGVHIATESEAVKNRYGEKVHFARYKLDA